MSEWQDYIDTSDGRYVGMDEADAAVAELEADLAVWEDDNEDYADLLRKCEQAEAEVERLTWQMEKAARIAGIDLSELDEAWAERGGEE
jgi:hypothetical protein